MFVFIPMVGCVVHGGGWIIYIILSLFQLSLFVKSNQNVDREFLSIFILKFSVSETTLMTLKYFCTED